MIVEVDSAFLAGVVFNFSSKRIADWRPLFDWDRIPDIGNDFCSKAVQLRNHWKTPELTHLCPTAQTDETLLGRYRVLADVFDHHVDGKADGVKGYTSNGRFCGLCFRRNGLWDEEPLGQSSPYETTFFLHEDEEFVSIYVSQTAMFGSGGALVVSQSPARSIITKDTKLCTNFGRTTPWIGNPLSGVSTPKAAPVGHRTLGIYLAFSEVRLPIAQRELR